MLHISLFSGVGGFDLASEWMGWKNIASCEINEFGNKVLEYYWPEAYHHRDIHTFTYDTIDHELSKRFGSHWRSEDIILTGGFPCQPYSTAGKRLGKADARHLWPEMCRAIREIQPAWIVGENVRGLISWNGGMVFDEVQAELEAEGYSVLPFVLPAVSVNAPHRRDRVFFVAYSKSARTGNDIGGVRGVSNGCNKRKEDELFVAKNTNSDGCLFGQPIEEGAEIRKQRDTSARATERIRGEGMAGLTANANNPRTDIEMPSEREWQKNDVYGGFSQPEFGSIGCDGDAADTDIDRLQRSVFPGWDDKQGRNRPVESIKEHLHTHGKSRIQNAGWQNFPTVSPIRMRDDGVSNKLLRFVVKEFYDTISYTSQENRIKNLQEVWESIQSEEIWEQIRGFYSLESKNVLFQTVQLYSSEWHQQGELSPFSKELCQPILQHLSKYKEFRCSPQGQELEKQRFIQFGNTLSFLPHEVALAARRFEAAIAKFESWHRNESIKAGGNAVVPQVVLQIFKAIEQYNNL